MLKWSKKRSVAIPDSCWYRGVAADGFVWQVGEAHGTACSEQAASALEQLQSDGLITFLDGTFKASWSQVFALLRNGDYDGISSDIAIPEVIRIAPSLSSVGTLTDRDFGITVGDWVGETGMQIEVEVGAGPVFLVCGTPRLMPEASWTVLEMINQFWRRDIEDRSPEKNREHWGRIRHAAVNAGCPLSDFLYRSVVVTPEKLQLDLRRVNIGDSKVVEVTPTFAGCPGGWIAAFDRSPAVNSRYDVATPEGICQVVISPQVGAVLRQIKHMGLGGSRRLAGPLAEAFVLNPFAALGVDASETIDGEHFEQAKATAGLT
ncbi:MAG: hypothetical protein H7232_05175, partial [Aeromicrobium sp.]|nr:hypothetical protein [Burkholderiales bacterium]